MGNGLGLVQKPVERHKGWKYPQPDSTDEIILKDACQSNWIHLAYNVAIVMEVIAHKYDYISVIKSFG